MKNNFIFVLVAIGAGIEVTNGSSVLRGEERRYLRPAPGELGKDIDFRLLDEEEPGIPEQRSLRILDSVDEKWTYIIQYTTNSSFPMPETACEVTSLESNETIQGIQEGDPATYSILNYGGSYNDPSDIYTSPYLHKCLVEGLAPDSSFSYTIGNSEDTFEFKTPPAIGEDTLKIAVLADVGQTVYSNMTMTKAAEWIEQVNGTSILWPGDLSYADGYQPRWDTFGRLAEKLVGNAETIWAGGNHEISDQESWVAFKARYAGEGPLWFSTKRGPVHFITLCSYCQNGVGSAQYRWLEDELSGVNRSITPWLIVQFHAPWYCSNTAHQQEGEEMRESMEQLLIDAKVDLVFAGHVHAYERTRPVENYKPTQCGITHITIGDAGNREEVANEWYGLPDWSDTRESSFGFGGLEILDANTAQWTWKRNPANFYEFPGQNPFPANPEYATVDTFLINRTDCRQL